MTDHAREAVGDTISAIQHVAQASPRPHAEVECEGHTVQQRCTLGVGEVLLESGSVRSAGSHKSRSKQQHNPVCSPACSPVCTLSTRAPVRQAQCPAGRFGVATALVAPDCCSPCSGQGLGHLRGVAYEGEDVHEQDPQ